jgi:SNF2 family DNA or RNA helicase
MRKKTDLHPYQQNAIDYLYEHDAALALLPVGAGKSVIGWTASQELRRDGYVKRPLVFAPMRVAQLVWPGERQEWEHLKDEKIVAWGGEPSSWEDSRWKTSRILWGKINSAEARLPKQIDVIKRRELEEKLKAYKAEYKRINREIVNNPPPECLHVTSYENLMWLCDLYQPGYSPFDLWIFDEIGKLKNPTSPRYKMVKKHTSGVKIVWGLNATPAPEGMEDLFAQVRIVDKGRLWGDSFYKWRQSYFMTVDYQGYKWRPMHGMKEKLLGDLNTLAFKVDESELAYHQSMQHGTIPVVLPPKAQAQYDEMENTFALGLDDNRTISQMVYDAETDDRHLTEEDFEEAQTAGDIVTFSAAAKAMKLRQIAQGFIYDEEGRSHVIHEEKAHALADLIEELNGEPLLVAYEFTQDLEAIRKVWKNLPYLGQGIPAATAKMHIDNWNAGKLPVLALHPFSAGHGLNLQKGGCHIAWYAIPWPLESFIQTNGRIDRQGQTRACFGHHIIAQGTVDERVSRVLRDKNAEQQSIIDAIRRV